MNPSLLLELQRALAREEYSFTLHAIAKMEERGIVSTDVEEALLAAEAEIIEDYPEDPRGASCLVLGWTRGGRPLHAELSYPPDVKVITVYEPDSDLWLNQRIRR